MKALNSGASWCTRSSTVPLPTRPSSSSSCTASTIASVWRWAIACERSRNAASSARSSARQGSAAGLVRVGDEDADRDRLGRGGAGADLVERLLDGAEQRLGGEAEEVDGDVRALEGALDDRAQADRAGGALADEDAAALARDDEALVAQDADRLLDGHAGDAVALGELAAGRELVARLERLGQDRGAQCAGDLDVWRAGVVGIESRHASKVYMLTR